MELDSKRPVRGTIPGHGRRAPNWRVLPLSATIPADRRRSTAASAPLVRAIEPRLRPLDILVLSVWCGLASGPARGLGSHCRHDLLRHQPAVPDEPALRLAGPIVQPAALLRDGFGPGLAARLRSRFGRWFGPRLIGFLAILPMLIVLSPRIYPVGLGDLRARGGAAPGLVPRATRDRAAAAAAPELSRPVGLGLDSGRLGRRAEMDGGLACGRPSVAPRQSAERRC